LALVVENSGHDLPKGTWKLCEDRPVNREHELFILGFAVR
jgi:hypothetical protein